MLCATTVAHSSDGSLESGLGKLVKRTRWRPVRCPYALAAHPAA
ncbi:MULTISPECIES: hypothetical protein [unclassified Streptomyces]